MSRDVNQVVFVHMSKNGGKSMEQAARYFLKLKVCNRKQGRVRGSMGGRSVVRQVEIADNALRKGRCNYVDFERPLRVLANTSLFKRAKLFTIVRNPASRFLSAFAQNFIRKDPMTLDKYVESMDLSRSLNPQVDKLKLEKTESRRRVISSISTRFFFVGITELYNISLCIVYFKVHGKLPEQCQCADQREMFIHRGKSGYQFNSENKNRVRNTFGSIIHPFDMNATTSTFQKILDILRKDFIMYAQGTHLLHSDLVKIEEQTGMRMMCDI